MTPKSFWTIAVKLFGVYLLVQGIIAIPSIFLAISTGINYVGANFSSMLCLVVAVVAIYMLAIRTLLFKPGWVINRLRLDRDFTEEVLSVNFSYSKVLRIVIILSGAWMITTSLLPLCRYIVSYAQEAKLYPSIWDYKGLDWLIFHIISCLAGYLIIIFNASIAKFFEKETNGELNEDSTLPVEENKF